VGLGEAAARLGTPGTELPSRDPEVSLDVNVARKTGSRDIAASESCCSNCAEGAFGNIAYLQLVSESDKRHACGNRGRLVVCDYLKCADS
jgi:hypothetical protein